MNAPLALYETPRPAIVDYLKTTRKEAVNIREGLLPGGKPFKQLAAHYLRIERACNLLLPWFDGECKLAAIPPTKWPEELADEVELVARGIAVLP